MVESTEAVTDTFSALSDPLRRYVLYRLTDQETSVAFDSLALRVAAWHTDTTPHAVDDATVTEIRRVLYHVHLPKLSDLGVITYEDDRTDQPHGRYRNTRTLPEAGTTGRSRNRIAE